jgi:serine-type D-Ala-D-Ala carboxypeptidase (penicillin-binding protein 5/6)
LDRRVPISRTGRCARLTRVLAAASGVLALLAAVTGLAPVPGAGAAAAMLVLPGGDQVANSSANVPPVGVSGGELVDASTGAVLWDKDSTVSRPMGSITKVMTALVVLQAGNLNQKITVSEAAIKYVERDGASSAGLILGDVLTVRQLLAAMLIPSGCDAAFLLATAYGPGGNAFVGKMNAMAKTLGLTSTHFSNFDGMPYPNEHSTYSSPADLIRLGESAMKIPLFRAIVADHRYYIPATDSHHSYLWFNTNTLIGSYRGALGIKTGDTKAAGNCLLFEARRGDVTLIGVVLHANPTANPSSAIDVAGQLLNWGFGQT